MEGCNKKQCNFIWNLSFRLSSEWQELPNFENVFNYHSRSLINKESHTQHVILSMISFVFNRPKKDHFHYDHSPRSRATTRRSLKPDDIYHEDTSSCIILKNASNIQMGESMTGRGFITKTPQTKTMQVCERTSMINGESNPVHCWAYLAACDRINVREERPFQ